MVDQERAARHNVIEQAWHTILAQFPVDDVEKTPDRVARYLFEALKGYEQTVGGIIGNGIFDSDYSNVIKIENI
jgi:GTP cyclohydrolase I